MAAPLGPIVLEALIAQLTRAGINNTITLGVDIFNDMIKRSKEEKEMQARFDANNRVNGDVRSDAVDASGVPNEFTNEKETGVMVQPIWHGNMPPAPVVPIQPIWHGNMPPAPPTDLDAELLKLANRETTFNRPAVPVVKAEKQNAATAQNPTPISEEKELSPRAKRMLESFQDAFPNEKFKVTEIGGQVTIENVGNKALDPTAKTVYATAPVIANFDPNQQVIGLTELQRNLSRETDPEKQVEAALRLREAAFNYQASMLAEARKQAQLEFGVGDLESAYRRSKELDAVSPHIPPGVVSRETLEVVQRLSAARVAMEGRVKTILTENPEVQRALNAADAVLSMVDIKSKVAGRELAQDERKIRQETRTMNIATQLENMDRLNRVSILHRGKPITSQEDATNIATMLVDGKIRLTDEDRAITDGSMQTLAMYVGAQKDPGKRTRALNVMMQLERQAIKDDTLATTNMTKFQEVIATPLAELLKQPDFDKFQREAQSIIAGGMRASGAEEQRMQASAEFNFKLRLLQDWGRERFRQNVRMWQGAIQGDEVAKAILKDKPVVNFREFVISYFNYNDGTNKAAKIKKIRDLTESAFNSAPDSVLIPKGNEATLLNEIDSIIAWNMRTAVEEQIRYRQGAAISDTINRLMTGGQ